MSRKARIGITRDIFDKDGKLIIPGPGLNYLCEGYKAFFGHIAPHMKLMAAELLAGRSPANIMLAMTKPDPPHNAL